MPHITPNSDLRIADLPEDAREEGARLRAVYLANLAEAGFLTTDGAVDLGRLSDIQAVRTADIRLLRDALAAAERLSVLDPRSSLRIDEVCRGVPTDMALSGESFFALTTNDDDTFEIRKDGVVVLEGRDLVGWKHSDGHVFAMVPANDDEYEIYRDGHLIVETASSSGWRVSGGHAFVLHGMLGGPCWITRDGLEVQGMLPVNNWCAQGEDVFTAQLVGTGPDNGMVFRKNGAVIADHEPVEEWAAVDGALYVQERPDPATGTSTIYRNGTAHWTDLDLTNAEWNVADGVLFVVILDGEKVVRVTKDGRTMLDHPVEGLEFSAGHCIWQEGATDATIAIWRDGVIVSKPPVDDWLAVNGRVITRAQEGDGSLTLSCDGVPVRSGLFIREWSGSEGGLLITCTDTEGQNQFVLRLTVAPPPHA